jgi:hypothetical protein
VPGRDREQDRREHGDDGDHDEQFDQRESKAYTGHERAGAAFHSMTPIR